jgi:hypothetical protein
MIDPACLSYYLALRYLPFDGMEWLPGIGPSLPPDVAASQIPVDTADEVHAALRDMVEKAAAQNRLGILLSGGIDSAILAAYLPPGAKAYTIDFTAVSGAPEADRARRYADAYRLDWKTVPVSWSDYETVEPALMRSKKAPLHAVEVALHQAARAARADGITHLLVGNGADSTFGGMDKLLSRDWSYDDFVRRYTFIDPAAALKNPVDTRPVFEPYRRGDLIDFVGFLKHVHGVGIIQAFQNSMAGTGLTLVEPFENLKLKAPLDLDRIRRGEPKYVLYDLFARLYPRLEAPRKVPFARPMDEWLAAYPGPAQPEFLDGLAMENFTGDQKYLLRGLDRFTAMLKEGSLCP